MDTEHAAWSWADKVDIALNHIDRWGSIVGFLVIGASAPTASHIGGPTMTGLYYLIPLVALGLFFMWRGHKRWERIEKAKPLSTPLKTEYRKERVRIADLASSDRIVRNAMFIECEIEGPVVLSGAGGSNRMNGPCSYSMRGGGGLDALFIVIPDDAPPPAGTIGIADVHFYRCSFIDVGIAMHADGVDKMKTEMKKGLEP